MNKESDEKMQPNQTYTNLVGWYANGNKANLIIGSNIQIVTDNSYKYKTMATIVIANVPLATVAMTTFVSGDQLRKWIFDNP